MTILIDKNISVSEKVHIAVSGGIDSMALMYAVVNSFNSKEIVIHHVCHNISKNTNYWCNFVEKSVKDLNKSNVKFMRHDVYISGSNIEAKARKERYNAIFNEIDDNGELFLAHHKDDSVENVMINLFKGRGLNGLTSLKEMTTVKHKSKKIKLIRPFLKNYTKQELVSYLEENGYTHIHDESNDSSNYDRNYIRNKAIPMLNNRFPSLVKNIISSIKSLQSSKDALDILIKDKVNDLIIEEESYSLDMFNKLEKVVKNEVLINIFRENGIYQYSQKSINECVKQMGTMTNNFKPNGCFFFKSGEKNVNIKYKKTDDGKRVFYID